VLVPAHGYRLVHVRAAPLFGTGALGRVRAATSLFAGTKDARGWLRAERPAIVLGFGGYAGAGAVLGAWSLGIPAAIHEANATGGVANRFLARVAGRVLLGFAEAAGDFPSGRTIVTGMPVRPTVEAAGRDRTASRTFRVLVLGGSLGSTFLNARVPDLLARVTRAGVTLRVRHQTGGHAPAPVADAYEEAGVAADVFAYDDELPTAYRDADFAIACAGASTLVELAAAQVPALLVPLGTAALDHQTANARAFAAATGAWWTTEAAWDGAALADRLAAFATSGTARAEAADRLAAAARPDAAQAVVAACEALATGHPARTT
jgi:UDP-N-acetylglucosamine--N-acetylmuramyl-(pentapeptide) pyrophosphoryl-undecaprenol N-acetylglucosamine transferase